MYSRRERISNIYVVQMRILCAYVMSEEIQKRFARKAENLQEIKETQKK